jgi:polyhydroxybutyrate depolymerase
VAARPRALTLVVVALALLAGDGCRRHKKPPPRVESVAGESTVLPRGMTAASVATRDTIVPLSVGGTARRYVLVGPSAPQPDRRYPLVLVFHGDGGDGPGFRRAWPFDRATGNGAILVYPEGLGRTWDLETLDANRDEAFVLAIIEDVAQKHAIDRARIFAAGYSSGGFLANVLACRHPGVFRAIASNAGGAPYHESTRWGNGFPKCPGEQPVAMLALHGESDSDVTPDSGRFSAEYWAYVNGCSTDAMETTGYTECQVYRGCPTGKAVGWCSIPKLGHWVWDSAAEASWSFFQRQ